MNHETFTFNSEKKWNDLVLHSYNSDEDKGNGGFCRVGGSEMGWDEGRRIGMNFSR